MISQLHRYQILFICLIGSVVRFVYGYMYEPWSLAPDHIAWEAVIEQGSFRYDHLIHYPHEGGTIVISLLAHFVELFTSISSLTILAFLFDFLIRFVQITVVRKVFNMRAALFFGLWTIFAAPIIIPWGSANFALHHLSSIFPFLLLYLLSQNENSIRHHLICGLFLGVAVWFSYSNVILIPVLFGYRLFNRESLKRWLFSLLSFSGVLFIHLLVRTYADAGFHLDQFELTSIRRASFSIGSNDLFTRITELPSSIANTALCLPKEDIYLFWFKMIYFVALVIALIGAVISVRKSLFGKQFLIILATSLFFLIAYIFSPFFNSQPVGNYISYRHMTYVLPILSLFIILGLASFRHPALVIGFLLLAPIQSSRLFTTDPVHPNIMTTKASGWTLGRKLGHDPRAIVAISDHKTIHKNQFIQGIGWGMSTALFRDTDSTNHLLVDQSVQYLTDVIHQYPEAYRRPLLEGVEFAFSDSVTPKLNPAFLVKISNAVLERINSSN